MSEEEFEENRTESTFETGNDDDNESEVEYPMINLKDGLNNSLKERMLKDAEKYNNRKQKLSQLKSSEFSSKIMIDNKLAQYQMTKAVNYFFSEFDYIREKIKRAQQNTMKHLQEIHLDKRKQLRETYKYHNEETRYAIQRMRDQEKFLDVQTKLENEMQKRKRSIAKLSFERRELLKEINSKDYKKSIVKNKKKDPEKIHYETLDQTDSTFNTGYELRSRSFLHAGAIEVSKDFNNPKAVKRSVEVIESYEKLPQIIIPEIVDYNEKIKRDTEQQNLECINEITIKNNVVDIHENNEIIAETIKENTKKKKNTAIQIMKERKIQKENKLKEILNLPYNTYRRNSKGKLQKIDNPLTKCEYQEPSNREKYNMRKILSGEKEKYQNHIYELKKTTELIVQDDNNISRRLNAPQMKTIKENIVTPLKPVGPNEWMRAYVSSNIPDDIDPSSTEAIIYCSYIRAPLHKYSHLPNYKLYHSPL